MNKETINKLNDVAMQIIMYAGDARKHLSDAMEALYNDADGKKTDGLLSKAKVELSKAHNLQTEIIQEYIEDKDQVTCLLFTHAQDTLMVVSSEMNYTHSMIKLYGKLKGMIKNA